MTGLQQYTGRKIVHSLVLPKFEYMRVIQKLEAKQAGGKRKSLLWRWQQCHVSHSLGCIHFTCFQQCVCVLCEFKMDMSIPNPANCEVHSVIQFLSVKEAPAEFIIKLLVSMVILWTGRMWQSCIMNLMLVHDEHRTGKPSVIYNDLNKKLKTRFVRTGLWQSVNCMKSLKCPNRWFMTLWKSSLTTTSYVHDGYQKCWLKTTRKTQMNAMLMFFMRHSDKSVKFLDSTVAEDETWVFYHTPESKQQSINWHHTHSPKKKKLKINLNQEKYGNCLLRLKGDSYAWFYASWDHHKCCSILWNDKKVQTCNFEQKTRDAERQHLLTAWQHEGAHCNSYPAVVAEFQLGSFGPSSSDPKPCCQRFPFVFAFKVTSDQPEVLRRWRGEKQSHYTVECADSRVLWHQNTKPCTQPKQMPWQGGNYVE